ncbi:MAG: outer membrane lipoprotein carrier protein LolA [Paludibacteraceae bacterium]|nr:outer membrane lipoprotein carrier protein LolA [Paludibacteraceae bacterium]
MKKILTILLCLTTLTTFGQNCEQIADQLIEKLNSSALKTDFNISVTQPDVESSNYSGQIIMRGPQFYLNITPIKAYFDGTTLYTHDTGIDEINITNPTKEELQDINPMSILQTLRQHSWLRFTDNFHDNTLYSIDLYPQNKMSEITKYTIQFRKTDLVPTRIIIYEIQNKTTTIILSGQKYGVDTTNRFTLDLKLHPKATINDLR